MNNTIYKQADSRWGSLYYPCKGYTVGGSGCGLVACVHIAIEQEAKKNWTPKTLRPWMVNKGYAIAGQGTAWNGITETLKYIGHKTVVKVWDKDPMTKAWEELNKGNRIGILLLDSHKAPDGRRFTSSGHYIAFTGYKVEGGKHWFYMKDSSPRNNSGWLCYEKSIRGCLPKLWIVERIPETKVEDKPAGKPYSGAFPSVSDNWRLIDEAASNKGKYATRSNGGKDGKKYHNKFTLYFKGKGGINSKGEMPNVYGYIPGYCTLFVVYCLVKTGLGKFVPLNTLNSKKNGYWWHAPSLMKYFKKKGWVTTNIKNVKVGAIAFKGKKSPTHTCIFVKYSGGYVYTWDGNVGGGVTYNKRKPSAFCGFANLPYKSYTGLGDGGVNVIKWQKFLNWFNGAKVVAEDGVFGTFTEKYTRMFQKDVGITVDGTVGAQTIAKAKSIVR